MHKLYYKIYLHLDSEIFNAIFCWWEGLCSLPINLAWGQTMVGVIVQFSSVAQSCPVSNFLRPHGLQHARLPCPSPTPRAYSNLMCIESVMLFNHLILCCPLLLLPSVFLSIRVFSNESFVPIRWPKALEFSASASILPMNIQGWFPLGWTSWISLQSKGFSRVFSTIQFKSTNSLVLSFLYSPTLTSICDYWKNHSFD